MPTPSPQAAWEGFWAASGAAQRCPELLPELLLAWSEPKRHYHTLRHLAECLVALESVWQQAERPAEISLALCFHDAIYDVRSHDNEERSADWACRVMQRSCFANDATQRVHNLIMATRHTGHIDTPDAALLVDIDLAILGAPQARFDEYEVQIHAEYAWVPEADYRLRRREILQAFLARPALYSTAHFHQALEARARHNLARSLDRLIAKERSG